MRLGLRRCSVGACSILCFVHSEFSLGSGGDKNKTRGYYYFGLSYSSYSYRALQVDSRARTCRLSTNRWIKITWSVIMFSVRNQILFALRSFLRVNQKRLPRV